MVTARRHLERGRVGRKRLQHHVEARQDDAAAEHAARIQGIDGQRGAGVDHDASRRKQLLGDSLPDCDQRGPAIGPELRRPRVAVVHARGFSCAISHSGTRRQRTSCASTRTRSASPATLT